MMLIALSCWIIFTQPIGHIHPPVVSCKYLNGSKIYLQQPQSNDQDSVERKKRSLTPETVDEPPLALPLAVSSANLDPALTLPQVYLPNKRNKRNVDLRETSWKEGYVVGKSPQIIDYSPGTSGHMQHSVWVSPRFNNEVFEKSGVHKVFFLILLLIVIGEFFR